MAAAPVPQPRIDYTVSSVYSSALSSGSKRADKLMSFSPGCLRRYCCCCCCARGLLGIASQGPEALQHLMSIHFSCPALGRSLLQQQRPAMLYFVFNRQIVAVVVAHDLEQGEFVAQVRSHARC